MQNIKEIIDNVIKNDKLWTYWGYIPNADIYNKEECRCFIRRYMQAAGTDSEFNTYTSVLNKVGRIDDTRYQHIVFTFFLGLAIYDKCEIIKEAIDKSFCNSNLYYSQGLKKRTLILA